MSGVLWLSHAPRKKSQKASLLTAAILTSNGFAVLAVDPSLASTAHKMKVLMFVIAEPDYRMNLLCI